MIHPVIPELAINEQKGEVSVTAHHRYKALQEKEKAAEGVLPLCVMNNLFVRAGGHWAFVCHSFLAREKE